MAGLCFRNSSSVTFYLFIFYLFVFGGGGGYRSMSQLWKFDLSIINCLYIMLKDLNSNYCSSFSSQITCHNSNAMVSCSFVFKHDHKPYLEF